MDSIIRPALLLMSGRALAFAATFFIPVVLVRVLDQAEFGTYKQLFLIYYTLYYIAQFGMATSLFYFLPRAPQRGGRYIMNSMLFLAASAAACLVLLGSISERVSRWLSNSEISEHIALLSIYLMLMLASAVLEIALISRRRYKWATFSYAFSDVLRAGLFIIPALIAGQLDWLLYGAVAFALLRFGATIFYLAREFDGELKPDAQLLGEQLAYSIPFGLAVLVEIIQSNFHHYAVSYSFDAATFAIYSVGCLQIPFVDFVATPAADVMMVRMSEKIRDGQGQAVLQIWRDTTRKLALIFFPMFCLLLVVAKELIVFLFTENYLASVPIFMVWSAIILLAGLMTDSVLRVYAQTRIMFALYLLKLLIIAASIKWFLSHFHLLGAVLVTISASLVTKGLALFRIKALMKVRFSELLPWSGLGAILTAAVAASLPVLAVKTILQVSPLSLLLTAGSAYALSYLGLLFLFDLLSQGERAALAAWLQRTATQAAKAGEAK